MCLTPRYHVFNKIRVFFVGICSRFFNVLQFQKKRFIRFIIDYISCVWEDQLTLICISCVWKNQLTLISNQYLCYDRGYDASESKRILLQIYEILRFSRINFDQSYRAMNKPFFVAMSLTFHYGAKHIFAADCALL